MAERLTAEERILRTERDCPGGSDGHSGGLVICVECAAQAIRDAAKAARDEGYAEAGHVLARTAAFNKAEAAKWHAALHDEREKHRALLEAVETVLAAWHVGPDGPRIPKRRCSYSEEIWGGRGESYDWQCDKETDNPTGLCSKHLFEAQRRAEREKVSIALRKLAAAFEALKGGGDADT